MTDGATLWLEGWQRRGGETNKGQPIKNVDLWQQLHDVLRSRRVGREWVKLPSHVDRKENKKADTLSDEGVKKHGRKIEEASSKEARATNRPARAAGEREESRRRLAAAKAKHPTTTPEPKPEPKPSTNPGTGKPQPNTHPSTEQPKPAKFKTTDTAAATATVTVTAAAVKFSHTQPAETSATASSSGVRAAC